MRLLLAEDEKELSNALVAILTHEKYLVDAVYNGQDAIDYLEYTEYDGAILDIMMPRVDGLTVLKKIREKGNMIPVLLLTAKSEIDDRVLGLDSGADDYLTKPFAAKELLARIRAMTRRQPVLQDTNPRFGNIVLNRADCSIEGPAGKERLVNKEFQLMETFLVNPGQIISTDRLFEKIWGYESDAEINVVWVNISLLRKKLDAVGADIRIKANRGLGYSLEAGNEKKA